MILISALLFISTFGMYNADPDCSQILENLQLKCCEGPIFEDDGPHTECDLNSGENYQCLGECFFHKTGIIENDELNVENLNKTLDDILRSDPDFISVLHQGFIKCYDTLKNAPTSPGNCSPMSEMMLNCAIFEMLMNCPSSKRIINGKCNNNTYNSNTDCFMNPYLQ